ncbi:MAG: hypothetical protein Q9220_004443 [cf. Caloplaca sp. 1 TL-2023]
MIKTYAHQPQRSFVSYDDDLPRKRIRMDVDGTAVEEHLNLPAEDPPAVEAEDRVPSSSTVPSSPPPADHDLFENANSRGIQGTSSPPSSPPPRLPSPEPATKKPAFSFLKRKRSLRSHDVVEAETEILSDIAPNLQSRPAKKPRLTQMQIDLGGEVQKKCKDCGMEYIPSNKEDAALHKDFHTMNIQGVDVGKKFLQSKDGGLKRAYPRDKRWLNEGEEMVMVDRKSPLWARNKVKRVLEVVNSELGSADVDDDDLWAPSMTKLESRVPVTKRKKNGEVPDDTGDRFKAFLHIDGDKCNSFCLAEKISSAKQVIHPEGGEDAKTDPCPDVRSSSISTSADTDVALLGIARIWTSKSRRGHGIAADLLETARGNFFYGVEVPKNLVAFSQPTESGGKLAERWYGCKTGWHVYGDQR